MLPPTPKKMAKKNIEKTLNFYYGSSHVLPRDFDLEVFRDFETALRTLFMREECNPGGRFELPQVMGRPGGKLDDQCIGEIMANVYENWDRKQLHVLMRGSNDMRTWKKRYLVWLEKIEQVCLFFKECREKGAKCHLIVCTPVPSPATPELEPLFRESEDILCTLLKCPDFKDSLSGVQPSFLNLSSLVPFRDEDGNVELELKKGSLFYKDHIHLNIVGTAKACTKLQINQSLKSVQHFFIFADQKKCNRPTGKNEKRIDCKMSWEKLGQFSYFRNVMGFS